MSKDLTRLLFIALILRFCWILIITPTFGAKIYGPDAALPSKQLSVFDGDGYLECGEKFQQGDFLDNPESIKRMPLYPGLIALMTYPIALITGQPLVENQTIVLRLLQCWNVFLDLSVLLCIYLLIKTTVNQRAALWGGYLYTFYPLAYYRLPMLNTEIIQAATLGFWILGAIKVLDHQRLRDALLLSLLSTVLMFISPATQFAPIGLVLLFLLKIRK